MGLVVPFFPHPLQALALIGVVIGLLMLARYIPAEPLVVRAGHIPPPRAFAIIGGTGMTLIMVGTFIVPGWDSRPSPATMFVALLAVTVVELGALLWLSNRGKWDDRHRLALVLGFLSFFLAFGILKDFESFTGRSLVTVATLWLLLRLRGQARNGPASQEPDLSHC
jgi:hypothetical protein